MQHTELLKIKELATEILSVVDNMNCYNPTPISNLNLSTRAMNCLKYRNIEYVEQLLKMTHTDLMRLRNMGNHTFNEINQKVKSFGLRGWEM